VELSKDGYTRSLRRIDVPSRGAARVRDARLTRLADPVAVDSSGATVAGCPSRKFHSATNSLVGRVDREAGGLG
jgi:hypothetical protein